MSSCDSITPHHKVTTRQPHAATIEPQSKMNLLAFSLGSLLLATALPPQAQSERSVVESKHGVSRYIFGSKAGINATSKATKEDPMSLIATDEEAYLYSAKVTKSKAVGAKLSDAKITGYKSKVKASKCILDSGKASRSPSVDPSLDPPFEPTYDPTHDSTYDSTYEPTYDPTFEPSNSPSGAVLSPSVEPTAQPSMPPTMKVTTKAQKGL